MESAREDSAMTAMKEEAVTAGTIVEVVTTAGVTVGLERDPAGVESTTGARQRRPSQRRSPWMKI